MRGARAAFLGIAGLAVLAGLAYLYVRTPGREVAMGRTGARALPGALLPGLDLEGLVLEGDLPVAGATVLVTSDEDGDAFSSARCPNEEDRSILDCPCAAVPDLAPWRFAEGRGEAEPIIETTTAEDGTFAVTGLAPGRYAVWVEAGPLAAVALGVEAGGAVELVLSHGVWYAGAARDEEGAPIEGALVAAVHAGHSRFFSAQTDEEGRFLLGPMPEGPFVVLAHADGRVPVLDGAPSGDMELSLVPAAMVEGMVVRDGEPVPGAEVRTEVSCSPLVATTDEKGRFLLDGLLPERATIAAFSGEDGGVEEVDLTEEDGEGLVIALRRGGAIAGEVRDEAGAPVEGARVAVEGERIETAAVTDGEGRFRVSGLAPDRYALWLFPPAGFVKPGRRSVAVVQGVEARTSYRLLRAAGLAGVTVDEEGWPVPGARIRARRAREGVPLASNWDAQRELEARSDRAGRFSLAHAAAGSMQLSIEADGFVPARLDATAPGEIEVRLRRGGSLEVAVVDEEGVPVPGALLTLAAASPRKGEASLRLRAAADAAGWHRFVGLPTGRYRLVAQLHPLPENKLRHVRTVAVETSLEAAATTELTLRFEAGQSIAGKVVEEGSGRPLAGVQVWGRDEVRDPPDEPGSARGPDAGGFAVTDSEGRFEIEHLRPHRHMLRWGLDGYDLRHQEAVRPGASNLVLTLKRRPQLTGRVVGEDGKPLERFTVGAQAYHAADGRFAQAIWYEHREHLEVQAEGFAPVVKELALDGRSDVDLGDIRLSRGRTVRISVVLAASSQPVRAAEVGVGIASEDRPWSLALRLARGLTGRDGTVTLHRLPGTGLDVLVAGDGLAPALVPLGAGATELTIRLGEGGRIEGTVRNAAGDPVRNVRVTAGLSLLERESTTDAEGRFAVEGLPPGEYDVELQDGVAEGNAGLSPRTVNVTGTATVRVDFRESAGASLTIPDRDDCLILLVRGALTSNADALAQLRERSLDPVSRRDDLLVFRGLDPGVYTAACVALSESFEPERVSLRRIEVAGADLEVTLPAPTTVVQEEHAHE